MNQLNQSVGLTSQIPIDLIDCPPDHPENIPKGISTEEIVRLKESGFSAQRIAKYLNISKATVFYHLQKAGQKFGQPTSYYQENKDTVLESIQERITVLGFDDAKIKKAGLKDVAIAFGTLEDKIRLIRGQSTQNIGIAGQVNHLLSNPDDLKAVLSGLADSYRQRIFNNQDTPTPNVGNKTTSDADNNKGNNDNE